MWRLVYFLSVDVGIAMWFLFISFRVRHSRGEMYSGHGRVCVCLYLVAFPHYCKDPNVTWGMIGVPSSCALLIGQICNRCTGFVAMTI